MVLHVPGILSDEVWLHLPDRLSTSPGAPFNDRFAEAGQACIGVHPEKQPARLDQESFEFGNPNWVTRGHGSSRGRLRQSGAGGNSSGGSLKDGSAFQVIGHAANTLPDLLNAVPATQPSATH